MAPHGSRARIYGLATRSVAGRQIPARRQLAISRAIPRLLFPMAGHGGARFDLRPVMAPDTTAHRLALQLLTADGFTKIGTKAVPAS